jgi:fructose-bisphosphate aldolase, class II
MPMTSILPVLARGQREGFAVPLIDIFDSLSTDGVAEAFAEKRAPGIIGVWSGLLTRPNAQALIAYTKAQIEHLPGTVSLMLDHGASLDQCALAIQFGFSDVMFDGSKLPLEENIAQTKAVVRLAHAAGVNVEAELGHVGIGSEYQEIVGSRKGYTDPAEVERFVAETGVDFLAVAVGTAHGVFAGDPKLDLDLLAEIRRRVDIPLVMHGGSGLSEDQFRAAIKNGIAKINVVTELVNTTAQRMREDAAGPKSTYHSMTSVAVKSYQERAGYYLDLFGASRKA